MSLDEIPSLYTDACLCKSFSILVYSSSVNSVIFIPAVEYTLANFGTSIHTYSFPEESFIVNPVSKLVPSTFVKSELGRYGLVPGPLGRFPTPPCISASAWYESILNVKLIAEVASGLSAKYFPTVYPHSESRTSLSPAQFTLTVK